MSETQRVSETQPISETRGGYRRSASGLVGAILACLLLFVVIWGLSRFQQRGHDEPAKTMDYSAELAAARQQAPFDVVAPHPAPTGWRATSVNWRGAGPEVSWHIGFLTDADDYVGLEQGNAIPADFVADRTPADSPAAPVTVDGVQWRTLTSADETALVFEGDGVTTIVTGTAPQSDLIEFAESLSVD